MDGPLTKAELKTVTLLLRNARDTCEVIEYIGELKLLEAASLGRHLGAVKEWLPRIEKLAEWRGELDVDLELFAADLDLVHGACELRLKLELEEYAKWFGRSAFHTMPRFMGRLSRLCGSLIKVERYTREAHDDMSDPSPPPSPAAVLQPAAVEENELRPLDDAAPDAAASLLQSTSFLEQVAPHATLATEEADDAESGAETEEAASLLYVPELDSDGFRVLPDGMFSTGDVVRLEQAKIDVKAFARARDKTGEAMSAAVRAGNVLREIYNRSGPLARANLADLHALCTKQRALADDVRRRRSGLEAQIAILRDALDYYPNDILLRERLAYALVGITWSMSLEELAGWQEEATLAVKLLKDIRAYFDTRGSFHRLVTTEEPWVLNICQALLTLGISVQEADRGAAVAAWEEALSIPCPPDAPCTSQQHLRLLNIRLHVNLAVSAKIQGEGRLALQQARRGLELVLQCDEKETGALAQTACRLFDFCDGLLPEEEKRLVKIVNIRRLQAKTRRSNGKKETEADKAQLAAAVAELAELRAFDKALKECKR